VSERTHDPELRQRVLDHVYDPQFRPSKPKEIHRALALGEDDYRALRKLIKRMVIDGELAYGSNHLVVPLEVKPRSVRTRQADDDEAPPAKVSGGGDAKLVRGKYRQAAAGFGFVRPAANSQVDFTEDIFIPADSTGTAMDGDQVLVRFRSSRREGGQEGVVLEIIERARRQFSGSYDVAASCTSTASASVRLCMSAMCAACRSSLATR
jgi:ribonuclease R